LIQNRYSTCCDRFASFRCPLSSSSVAREHLAKMFSFPRAALAALVVCASSKVALADGDLGGHEDHELRWCCRKGKEYNGETELERCEKMVPILNYISTVQEDEDHQIVFSCVELENCDTVALAEDPEKVAAADPEDLECEEHHDEDEDEEEEGRRRLLDGDDEDEDEDDHDHEDEHEHCPHLSEADIVVMDGADMFEAYKQFNFTPVLAEVYEECQGNANSLCGGSYFAVAAIRKSDCESGAITNFLDLKGKTSCHTGYGRTSGWKMPFGYLSTAGFLDEISMDANIPNDAEAMDAFFGDQCAPQTPPVQWSECGSLEEPINHSLCQACGSDCTDGDTYAGYGGSLRCLVEGPGDVAFFKHTTIGEFIDEDWFPTDMSADDLVLLCPADSEYALMNGGSQCAPIGMYGMCNLGRVPAEAVGVHDNVNLDDTGHIYDIFAAAVNNQTFYDLFLAEDANPGGLVFNKELLGFLNVTESTPEYMGETFEFFEELAKVDDLECQEATVFGDYNLDGIMNVLDIVCTTFAILNGNDGLDTCEYNRSDINEDTTVNVLDVVLRVNEIIGG